MLRNHKLEDVGMVFPHHFHELGILSLNMVVYSFVCLWFNAPLPGYIVKLRNIKVAITGQVQLSNLISIYNGNKE